MSTAKEHNPDPDVEAAFRWLLSYLLAGDWAARRAAVERHIEAMVTPRATPPPGAEYHRLVGPEADSFPSEGFWKGKACAACKRCEPGTPATGRHTQKALDFTRRVHGAHRRSRFCIGK